MKFYKILIICFSLFILLNILSSCEDRHEPNYEPFLITVDRIQVPANITINEPFDIEFYGIVGNSGCYRFSQFKTEVQGNNILIEAWGEFDRNSNICPSVMVCLDNEKLNYLIKEKGIYTIKVKRPDGNYIEQQISVK